jgi:hypothetical protein
VSARVAALLCPLCALLSPLLCAAQQPHEREIQRAIIELDRRSADFSNSGRPLEPQVGQPLHPDPEVARQLRPYERLRIAEEDRRHVLQLPPPVVQEKRTEKGEKPLPLPGGPRPGVDPVAPPRVAD